MVGEGAVSLDTLVAMLRTQRYMAGEGAVSLHLSVGALLKAP